MKTFKFSLVLHTRENTDVFITLDDNIYGIHSQRVNILYISLPSGVKLHVHLWNVGILFIFSSILQIWYVKVRISGSIWTSR